MRVLRPASYQKIIAALRKCVLNDYKYSMTTVVPLLFVYVLFEINCRFSYICVTFIHSIIQVLGDISLHYR